MTLAAIKATPTRAFALIELLVVVSILSLLVSMLLPSLSAARAQARASVCGSNIRQVAIANLTYAAENGGRSCPGAPRIATDNLSRWHGARRVTSESFDASRSPLRPHLGADAQIRACPAATFNTNSAAAFEKAAGGYGYNLAYLGRVIERPRPTANFRVVTDLVGASLDGLRRPGETLMFADSALAAVEGGVIEYSFAEPRFHPEFIRQKGRADPSIHFRHRGQANIAWADGHVDRAARTFVWKSGLYSGDPAPSGIGWFGDTDDNGYFDHE